MTTSIAEPVRDDRAAVDKAISLLAAFGEHAGTGIGVSELARRAQLSKSTAFRVLGMLERNGVVERIGTGYRLGARLQQLGQAVCSPEHEQIRDLLLPFLTDLYELTRHTVHLGALHGTDVVYLAKLYGHRTIAAPSKIGGRLPAHCTAVGKVLLAYHSHTAAQALTTPLSALTPHTIVDPARLTDQLTGIRSTGIAHDAQESRLGLSCLAAPVFDHRGRVLAALSVAGPSGRLETHRLETSLRQICASATQMMARTQLPRRP
ncbi:IclR family transcriptional regulator [Nocardia pseudovaccinii]|uniref:IclR family transcriptional regulator n=1 Tax=Nocardia pseudovaccinii TaxID=189540 RepID=UPI0007A56174|nr:IclR family transcriptional regulator [Nocardia pseudovaccinii]